MELRQCATFDSLCDDEVGNETALYISKASGEVEEVGFLELRERSIDVATQLVHRFGVVASDRVLIFVADHFPAAYVCAMLACIRIGALWVSCGAYDKVRLIC